VAGRDKPEATTFERVLTFTLDQAPKVK